MDWIKRNFLLVLGAILVLVFVLGGLATNDPGTGGHRDVPPGEYTGHYVEEDGKKVERR